MYRRSLGFGVLGVGIVLLASSFVRAGYVTTTPQTDVIGLADPVRMLGSPTDWDTTTPGLPGHNPFEVEKFREGPPQSLSSVNLSMTYHFVNNLTFQFSTLGTLTLSYQDAMKVTMPGNSGDLLNLAQPNMISQSMTPTPTQAMQHQMVTESFSYSSTVSTTYKDAAHLAAFTGQGTLALPAYATGASSFSSSSGNGFGLVQTLAWVSVSLSYTFLPEPSSLVLTGLGISGLLFIARGHARRLGGVAA